MKGLLKNNYFAVRSNAKAFSVFMLLLGIFVVAVISPSLLMGYALLGMIGFSLNAIAGLRKESSTKWSKYKLTAPVKRSDIVKSYFSEKLFYKSNSMVDCGNSLCGNWRGTFHYAAWRYP